MMLQIAIILLLAITMTLSQPAYAATTGDTTTNEPSKDSTSNTNTGNEQTKDTGSTNTNEPSQPKSEPQPKPEFPTCDGTLENCQEKSRTTAKPEPTEQPTKTKTTSELPQCDGTFKDCKTRNGDICKAGEGGEKCECLPDMSDCPNHPSIVNPIIPSMTVTASPDQSCLFHPEQAKCKSDNGVCPDGFAQNEDGNCFPRHDKCPKGFHGHEDDETGRCIPDSVPCDPGYIRNPDFPTCSSKASVCRDHPELRVCGGDGHDHDSHGKKVIIIHKSSGSTSGSNNNNHNLSANCFEQIKIAWLGKVSRGEDSNVDNIIDKCLGIH